MRIKDTLTDEWIFHFLIKHGYNNPTIRAGNYGAPQGIYSTRLHNPIQYSAAFKLCPDCPTTVPINSPFCQNCGYKF